MRKRKEGIIDGSKIKVLGKKSPRGDHVHLFLIILTKDFEAKYNPKPRVYLKYNIHKKSNDKYYKSIARVIDYLHECRGGAANATEYLIRDYLECIYQKYQGYGRVPTLNQLGAYTSNQIAFDDWVSAWEEDMGETYWVSACDPAEIKRKAHEAVEGTARLQKQAYEPISNVNVIEV